MLFIIFLVLAALQLVIVLCVYFRLKKKSELTTKNLILDSITYIIIVNLFLVLLFSMTILILDTVRDAS